VPRTPCISLIPPVESDGSSLPALLIGDNDAER
jgi:hypothetical protein